VSAHSDGAVRVWDHSARLLGCMPAGAPVTALVAAHGEWVAAGTAAGKVLLWRGMRLVAALAAHAGSVSCVALAPQPQQLQQQQQPPQQPPGPGGALVLASGGEDGNVALRRFEWDGHAPPREVQVRLLLGHQGPVRDVYVDEYKIVSCGEDGTIKFWDLAGHEPRTLRTLKFRKGNKTLPILSLVVAPSFVLGARSDASVVGFTLHNSWAALLQPPEAAPRGAPAPVTPATLKKKSVPKKQHHQPRARRETPPPRAAELADMLFEDQFDAWDLQFEHDLLSG
jgi:WD40 repeat protein